MDPEQTSPDEEQELLRRQLGLEDGEVCPTVDAFAYAEKVTPRRGWYEVEDGVIGVYDRKGEILTALPPDFDPYAAVPCEACGEDAIPMDLRCQDCAEPIDPSWVWSYWYGEDEDEDVEEASTERVRLVSYAERADAIETARALRDAGVGVELVDETDAEGDSVTAVWIDRIDLGTAQNTIARPGVEG